MKENVDFVQIFYEICGPLLQILILSSLTTSFFLIFISFLERFSASFRYQVFLNIFLTGAQDVMMLSSLYIRLKRALKETFRDLERALQGKKETEKEHKRA